MMDKNIFLIGFMGTGKSTVSRRLGSMLKFSEKDLDQEIEAIEKRKISEIFETDGEAYFRDEETALICEFEKKPGYVVSCGGGAVLRRENVESMKRSGTIVLLTAEPKTVYERVRYGNDRPLLKGKMNVEYIAELMERRRTLYQEAADITVRTDEKSPENIAKEIIEKIIDFQNEV